MQAPHQVLFLAHPLSQIVLRGTLALLTFNITLTGQDSKRWLTRIWILVLAYCTESGMLPGTLDFVHDHDRESWQGESQWL